MDHVALDRPRPHQRHFDHQVVEATRLQARQHGHLGARLDLEDTHAVGVAEHLVGGRVLGRDFLQRERSTAAFAEDVQRLADRRQHAERQDVDLQQAHRVEIVLVPLDDAASGHRRILDRHQPGQRPARNDEAADVLRQVAGKATQGLGDGQPFADARRLRVEAEFGETLRQLLALVPPGQRGGQRVDLRDTETERAAGIAQRALGPVGDHRRRQRRPLAAVPGVDVLDDFLAPFVLEIDVDVRRLAALLRDEALEEQRRARRVDLGDGERVAHRRIGRRTAPLAQDSLTAGEADDVVDGQEIGFVAQLGDQRQFVLDTLAHLARHACRITPSEAGPGFMAQPGGRRVAVRDDLLRVLVAQFVERKVAARGDGQRFGQQIRRVEARQAEPRAQVALAVGKQRVTGSEHRRFQA